MTKTPHFSFLDVILPSELADKGILVGSRAQGVANSINSDWDYMFLEEHKEEILNFLNTEEIRYTINNLNGSIKFYVMVGDIRSNINFIFIDNQETYNAWIKATEILLVIGRSFTSKRSRIKAFCDLVVYFGGEPSKYPNFCS